MAAYRSHGTTHRHTRAAAAASRTEQSTGALLTPAGERAPGPGHRHGARARRAGRHVARFIPAGHGTGGTRPGR